MLVLTRRTDESIAIGDSIIVTVLGVEGDRVKLGIQAPRDIPIVRQEMYQAVQEQAHIQELLASEPDSKGFEELRKLLSSAEPDDSQPDQEDED